MKKLIILYSDGTWSECSNPSQLKEKMNKHWWPFPIDKKGDPRRNAIVFEEPFEKTVYEKI